MWAALRHELGVYRLYSLDMLKECREALDEYLDNHTGMKVNRKPGSKFAYIR